MRRLAHHLFEGLAALSIIGSLVCFDAARRASGAADEFFKKLALVFLAVPAVFMICWAREQLALRRLRRTQERSRFNRCLSCGYDLRASPKRCPECGAAAADGRGAPSANGDRNPVPY